MNSPKDLPSDLHYAIYRSVGPLEKAKSACYHPVELRKQDVQTIMGNQLITTYYLP